MYGETIVIRYLSVKIEELLAYNANNAPILTSLTMNYLCW